MFNVSLHLCSVHSSITSLPTPPLAPVLAGLPSKLEKTWLQSSGKPGSVTQYWEKAETPKSRHCTLYCCPGSHAGPQPKEGCVTPALQREAWGWWGSPGATSELGCAETAHSELPCLQFCCWQSSHCGSKCGDGIALPWQKMEEKSSLFLCNHHYSRAAVLVQLSGINSLVSTVQQLPGISTSLTLLKFVSQPLSQELAWLLLSRSRGAAKPEGLFPVSPSSPGALQAQLQPCQLPHGKVQCVATIGMT